MGLGSSQGFCIRADPGDPLTRVRRASIADDLSQQDAEGPDVRFDGERAVVDGLRGRPLDGEFGSWVVGKDGKKYSQGTMLGPCS